MPKEFTKGLIRIHNRDAIDSMRSSITTKVIESDSSLKLDMTKILERKSRRLGRLDVCRHPRPRGSPQDVCRPGQSWTALRSRCGTAHVGLPPTLFMGILKNPGAIEAKDLLDLGGTLPKIAAASVEVVADGLPKYSIAGK